MARTESKMLALGTLAPEFSLLDTISKQTLNLHALNGEKGTVIMFICNHCPFVIHVNPEITKKELQLVYKFTDIRNGDLFELNKIYKISENIKNTGFIEEIRPPAYEFIDNKASIYTYFKPQSKNSINGLVGIQPGENETVQFTGNVALNFHWKSILKQIRIEP